MDGQAGGRPGRYTACRTARRCGAVPDVRRRTDCAMNDKKFVICRVFVIFDVVCICLIDYEQIMKDSHEIS